MKNEHRNVSIETLKTELLQELQEHHYTPKTIQLYFEIINRIHRYMAQSSQPLYSPEIGKEFLRNDIEQKSYAEHTVRFFKTVVRRLNDCYFGSGYILSVPRKNLSVPESFQACLKSYYKHCKNNCNSDTTMKMKQRACHFFCSNVSSIGCQNFETLNIKIVSRVILMEKNHEIWPCIKDLLLYLAVSGITTRDFSTIVPRSNRGIKIPSTYSNEEISRLENTVDRTVYPGKRNYAMILLASRLGIRAGDIAGLHLSDLDFENERIRFVQRKTGNPSDLPMIPEIKNALQEYLSTERPISELNLVFLSSFAPYGEISYSVVSFTVKKYMKLARVDTFGKKHGPHSLRSSLATSMVNDGIGYDSVRKVLGHEGANAIKHYAKLDIERLRLCALESPVETGFFKAFLEGGDVK